MKSVALCMHLISKKSQMSRSYASLYAFSIFGLFLIFPFWKESKEQNTTFYWPVRSSARLSVPSYSSFSPHLKTAWSYPVYCRRGAAVSVRAMRTARMTGSFASATQTAVSPVSGKHLQLHRLTYRGEAFYKGSRWHPEWVGEWVNE